jgi:hypothetical protein
LIVVCSVGDIGADTQQQAAVLLFPREAEQFPQTAVHRVHAADDGRGRVGDRTRFGR